MKRSFPGLLLLAALAAPAWAQSDKFPVRPIQVVINSTPGSTSDILMRFLGVEAAKTLGQPTIVIAKPSENSVIGADFVRRAPADGYTLMLGSNTSMAANVHLIKNLSYDPLRDFEPVGLLSLNPLLLVVRADLPIQSVQELVAYAKARPGKLNYGVGNSGGKIAVSLMSSMTGIEALEVPFKGASQAVQELIAGRLDFMVVDPLVVEPFIRQGTLRPLAVTSAVRLPTLAAVPTMAEAGLPGYEYSSFLAFYAPKGTPKAAIDTIHQAFSQAVNSAEGQAFYQRMRMLPATSTPAGLRDFTKEQMVNWGRLVTLAGLQAQ